MKLLLFNRVPFIILAIFITNICFSASKVTKIVAVHSYSEDFPWTRMISEAYKAELLKTKLNFDINSFYFNAKKSPIPINQTHPLIREIEVFLKKSPPDIIFITDDFALNQMSHLLIQYRIPYVFAGINGEIPKILTDSSFKKYSGVLERYYVADSVHLLERLLKKNKLKLLVLLEKSETSDAVEKYVEAEMKKHPQIKFDVLKTNDFEQWKAKILNNKEKYDALLPLQPYSLNDISKKYIQPQEVVSWIYKNTPMPTIFTAEWHIKCGGTLAIAHRPSAQGLYAAKLTNELLRNSVSQPLIPPQGDILINYISAEKLKIKIPFDLLSTAKIQKKVETPCSPK